MAWLALPGPACGHKPAKPRITGVTLASRLGYQRLEIVVYAGHQSSLSTRERLRASFAHQFDSARVGAGASIRGRQSVKIGWGFGAGRLQRFLEFGNRERVTVLVR